MSSVTVDFGVSKGTIKPLQGVNNGPVGYGGLVDVSHYYKELAVPYVRLHDPNWPHPREVDIPQVFPDFNADPDDPSSYQFDRTDRYIKRILDTGAKIVYRLGVSIEHTERKYFTDPPSDFEKWARICIGIIKHYNHGWADGMRDAVAYWEIWNEPEIGPHMWTGTYEQYLDLYRITASAIKSFDPGITVGGYAAAFPQGQNSRVAQFLAFCREHDLPLDFFSWHTYGNSSEELAGNARVVRGLMAEHGYGSSESHLNEWNLWRPDNGPVFAPGHEYMRRDAFERQKNQEGASFAAGSLILLQDADVDVANYYDGQPLALYCGLFDYYGVPQKTYSAFKAFREVLDCKERVGAEATASDGNLYSLAAIDRASGEAAILISRFDGATDECSVELSGLPTDGTTRCDVYLIDKDRNFEPVTSVYIEGGAGSIGILLRTHSVALVKIQ